MPAVTATVTGNYFSLAGQALPTGVLPRLQFRFARRLASIHGDLVSGRWEDVPVSASGAWSLSCIPTTHFLDRRQRLIVRGSYQDPNAFGAGQGRGVTEVFEFEVAVPEGTWPIGQLVGAPPASAAWVLADPSISLSNPPGALAPGFLYLSGGDDPDRGTGDLYEVVS